MRTIGRLAAISTFSLVAAVTISPTWPSVALGQQARARVQILTDRLETGGGISFATNSSELHSQSFAILQQVAEVLRRNPSITVEVQVHSDSLGSGEYNHRLSHERANAIYQTLVQLGVDARRLTFHGYGETCPIASNRTAEGRATNRRVVFFRTDSGAARTCPIPPPPPPPQPASDPSSQFPDPEDAIRQGQY